MSQMRGELSYRPQPLDPGVLDLRQSRLRRVRMDLSLCGWQYTKGAQKVVAMRSGPLIITLRILGQSVRQVNTEHA